MPRLTSEILEMARRRLFKLHLDSGSGHLGSNLSCFETLLCLYHDILQEDDTFVLSKGHSVAAQYVALWSAGLLDETELQSFLVNGTRFPGHPPTRGLPFSPFATGSLGHGLSLAAGVAKGNLLANKSRRVYCLTSDGEWQEGQCWEALTFSLGHKLKNLSILVDLNGLQGFSATRLVDPVDLQTKLRGFGAGTQRVDGHDPGQIRAALAVAAESNTTEVILLKTVKGRGVAGWENEVRSHYSRLDERKYLELLEGETR